MPYARRRMSSGLRQRRLPAYTQAYSAGLTRRFRYDGRRTRFPRTVSRARAGVRRARARSTVVTPIVPQPALAQCALDWAKSVMDPFTGPVGACNPFTPSVYSERVRVWSRTTLNIGDYSPAASVPMLCVASPCGDYKQLLLPDNTGYTTSTYFSTYMLDGSVPNSPYMLAQLAAQNSYTIVSMGIRIRYDGKVDDMNGHYGLYEDPGHNNLMLSNSYNQTITSNSDQYKIVPISNDWVTLCWTGPRKPSEYQYSNINQVGGITAQSDTSDTTMLYINVVTDTSIQSKFIVETVLNFEITGRDARGPQWSEQKVEDAAKVQNAVQRISGGKGIGGDVITVQGYVVRLCDVIIY